MAYSSTPQSRVRGEVLSSGLVERVRADGFHYRPSERVDWMVCDIADRPGRVAALVACWLGERWCERCLFNLQAAHEAPNRSPVPR